MRKNKIISVSALIAILSCVLGISSFAEVDALDNAVKPFGERTIEALGNLVLGMLVVFAVMAILCIILSFTGKFFSSKEKKTDVKKVEAPVAPAVVEEVPANNDEEIVAAITAAVACVLASEGTPAPAFRVVSFKKTNTKRSWNNVE